MSNNKQTMKLYTEEQVKSMLVRHLNYFPFISADELKYMKSMEDYVEEVLDEVTPIEIPSDEEIDAHVEDDFLNSTEVHKYSEEAQLLMKAMCKAGALWMRDKIGGNNEQQ